MSVGIRAQDLVATIYNTVCTSTGHRHFEHPNLLRCTQRTISKVIIRKLLLEVESLNIPCFNLSGLFFNHKHKGQFHVYLKVCAAISLMSALLVVSAVTQLAGDRSNMSGSIGQAVQESA